MAYCTQCGSVAEGRFCPQCGATVGAQSPQTPAPPTAQPTVPAAGTTALNAKSPLVWVLGGCLGLILIGGLIAAATGWFVVNKAKEAGFDPDLMRRNPTLAVTRMLTALNTDLEVLSVDEGRGIITVREKSSGKTVMMNIEDVKEGRIVFHDGESGEEVAVQAQGDGESGSFNIKTKDGVVQGGTQWAPPDWVPVYSGAKVEGGANSQTPSEDAGGGSLSTNDSIEEVLKFYEDALKENGFEVSAKTTAADGQNRLGTISGKSSEGNRQLNVVATADGGGTKIHVTYSLKK
jgi:hypothetical protein